MKINLIIDPLPSEKGQIFLPEKQIENFDVLQKQEFVFEIFAYSGVNVRIDALSIRDEIRREELNIQRSKERLNKLLGKT